MRKTSYQSWFLVKSTISQARLLQHSRLLQVRKLIIQTTIQQSSQVKVWIDKHGETRTLLKHQKSCYMNQPKSQNQIKMRITNKYGEARIPTYQNGCKKSERILWMTEFLNTHASSSHEPSSEPMRSVDLGKHSIYTHYPKDRNCEICQRTKITRAPCRRRNGGAVPRAENFGDLITADYKIVSEGCESRNNHRYAVVVTRFGNAVVTTLPM